MNSSRMANVRTADASPPTGGNGRRKSCAPKNSRPIHAGPSMVSRVIRLSASVGPQPVKAGRPSTGAAVVVVVGAVVTASASTIATPGNSVVVVVVGTAPGASMRVSTGAAMPAGLSAK